MKTFSAAARFRGGVGSKSSKYLALLALGGCAATVRTSPPPVFDAPVSGGKADGACPAAGPSEPVGWNGWWSSVRSAFRDPASARHAVIEPILNEGEGFTVQGRFSYGINDHALGHEDVVLHARGGSCSWVELGRTTTDDEGNTALRIPAGWFVDLGAYELQWVVLGDLTRAVGHVWVVAPGQDIVVFDIDGTVAAGDTSALVSTFIDMDTDVAPGAQAVVARYVELGYLPIYLTGRPRMLHAPSRQWLDAHGFPAAPLITSPSVFDSLGSAVELFKRDTMSTLRVDQGLEFAYAYGNATTDICAYAEAGIAESRTYIRGSHAGEACEGYDTTQPITSFADHLPELVDLPPAE